MANRAGSSLWYIQMGKEQRCFIEVFGSIKAFSSVGVGSQGAVQAVKALTCCFMAGVASTLVASG